MLGYDYMYVKILVPMKVRTKKGLKIQILIKYHPAL